MADEPAGDEPTPSLLYLIGRLDRAVRTRLGAALAPYGLTVSQFTTLSVLARRPGLSNAQLARRALITPQSMIQVVAALESAGLVARSPAHGRTLETELTTRGRRALADAAVAASELEDELVGAADPETVGGALALLQAWGEALALGRAAG